MISTKVMIFLAEGFLEWTANLKNNQFDHTLLCLQLKLKGSNSKVHLSKHQSNQAE